MRKLFVAAVVWVCSVAAFAQSGTNSPYSQYGLGALHERSVGFNSGMAGVGQGFREHNQVNVLNPASYSSVDSLTFIFDIGMSMWVTNFKEGGNRVNANNANFEYVLAGFRMAKHLGFAFGIMPYTNIGYDYSYSEVVGDVETENSTYYVNTYSGSGGTREVFVGMGWEPFKGLSIGFNAAYFWGSYERYVENAYTDSYVNTLSKQYTATINSYRLDFGLQYTAKVTHDDRVTLGLTYSNGHKLGTDPECLVISENSQTGVADTAAYAIDNGLEIPETFGAGLAWDHKNKLKVGFDFQLQRWGKIQYPVYDVTDEVPSYILTDGIYSDRKKFAVGGVYCADEYGRTFMKRIRYRVGASYSTPYLTINGYDGPKEYSVTAGFGIPIMNSWNSRSIINISAEWIHRDAKHLITENAFCIKVGITFNERWFSKWKME